VNWEYTSLVTGTNDVDSLTLRLTGLGSLGWEMCGFAAADATIGLNCLVAVLKRPAPGFAPPADLAVAWHPDPSGRFVQRYWDGLRWTVHVTGPDGSTAVDYPNVRPAADQPDNA
jgi:hypothetical protein